MITFIGGKDMLLKGYNSTWIYEPKEYNLSDEKLMIKTEPKTDFWQRTYYGFQNDNAPALLIHTSEKYFCNNFTSILRPKNIVNAKYSLYLLKDLYTATNLFPIVFINLLFILDYTIKLNKIYIFL